MWNYITIQYLKIYRFTRFNSLTKLITFHRQLDQIHYSSVCMAYCIKCISLISISISFHSHLDHRISLPLLSILNLLDSTFISLQPIRSNLFLSPHGKEKYQSMDNTKIGMKRENSYLKMIVSSSSSSTIRLRPLGLFLPPRNHLLISFVVLLYFFSLQVCNLIFFCSVLSSILCICSLQFILYYVNLSLILKMPNCSLMSVLLFCEKVYILPLVLKISF